MGMSSDEARGGCPDFDYCRRKFFVRAGPWCWVSEAFENERLGLHYLCTLCTRFQWVSPAQTPPNQADSRAVGIFLCQLGVIVLYAALGIKLIRKVRQFAAGVRRGTFIDSGYSREITRVAALLVLYPIIYIALTLPLSAGRMWSMAREGQHYSMTYAVFAGCMITSCGVADVLVYSLTRLRLLRATGMAPDEHRRLNGDGIALHSRTASHGKTST